MGQMAEYITYHFKQIMFGAVVRKYMPDTLDEKCLLNNMIYQTGKFQSSHAVPHVIDKTIDVLLRQGPTEKVIKIPGFRSNDRRADNQRQGWFAKRLGRPIQVWRIAWRIFVIRRMNAIENTIG